MALLRIPLESLSTLYIFENFPRDLYEFSAEARLKNIVAFYPGARSPPFLKTRNIGDQ